MTDQHVLYFDRDLGKIHGRVTLQRITQNGYMEPLFLRLPAASGQYPYTDGGAEDWVIGKGPTPMGTYYLSTKREALKMEPKGTPFYVISSLPGERFIGPWIGGKKRFNVGLHLENRFPGSAGCCVLLNDTPARRSEAYALFACLDKLNAQGVKYIKMIVL